ncbi:MAG: HK97 family phage prohead protease [Alphaproteobacteria bacterium]|nr:HK97 family phage prohead protease [Alphaproteobacteria bacterium]
MEHLTRTLAIKDISGSGIFTGYASVFGMRDDHNETVAAGAFVRTLQRWRQQGRMPALLWMHDPGQPVGIWQDLREDENGLAVQGRLALRTQKGMEAYELLKLGAVTGLSIGYRVVESRVAPAAKAGRPGRLLTDIDLFEISLVTFPANDAARIHHVKAPIAGPKNASGAMRAAAARLNRAARTLGTAADGKTAPRGSGNKEGKKV